jgi:3-keto-5-aminohexanoate cleavage enzyme
MDKRFISVAPVGYADKNIPSPEEIADITYRCWNAGASIVHLHAVDKYGDITSDLSLFKQSINLIKEKCDIIIQGSTGGISTLNIDDRSLVLGIDGVKQASLNMGSVNLFGSVFENSEEDIRYIAKKMNKYGVRPELEIFNEPMIDFALELRDEGLLLDPLLFQIFVIDSEGKDFGERKIGKLSQKQRRTIAELECIPSNCEVSICSHGRKDFSIFAFALSMGVNIRVGFEDSKYISPGVLAKDNVEIVEEVVKIMRSLGLESMNPNETRKILKINK